MENINEMTQKKAPIEDYDRYEATIPDAPQSEENKIRPINIEELNRGYIVRIGCHTFAISTKL
jgi:hypothetical protein